MQIILNRVTKKYGDKVALDDISFTLEHGVYGLLGPNGAGKSTLMNLLTCNMEPTSGSIVWDGKLLSQVKKEFRAVLGYMPQQQAMYPTFTAAEYLSYIAALHGMNKKDAGEAIERVLCQVELSDVANRKIRTFSGGMKQRLFLAQAILADPKVLILDEPTAGLDPYQRIAIRNMIAEMAADRLILIATHVVQDVEHISKEVLLLREGQLVRKAPPQELCRELGVSSIEEVYLSLFGNPVR